MKYYCRFNRWVASALVALSLTGCAALSLAPLDTTLLHDLIVLQETNTNAGEYCDSSTNRIASMAEYLKQRAGAVEKYTRYSSKDLHPIAADLLKVYTEFQQAYGSPDGTPSTAYCKDKLSITYKILDRFIDAAGNKPR